MVGQSGIPRKEKVMLTKLHFNTTSSMLTNKIRAIKAIRALSGLGLKDAKELIETYSGEIPIIGKSEDEIKILVCELKNAGVKIKETYVSDIAINHLEDALQEAVASKDFGLAKDVLTIIERYRS